jgi:hypothetical protein
METETTDAATAAVEPDAVSGLDERQWMRFPVADEHRSVELIVDGKTKYDAVLVDLSSTGMCVELEESIPVTVGEDVFVDAGYCIHACVVRNHAVKEGSGYQLGLERVKTFPVSQLPKKRRAIRTFLVPATTNSITPVIFVTLIKCVWICLLDSRAKLEREPRRSGRMDVAGRQSNLGRVSHNFFVRSQYARALRAGETSVKNAIAIGAGCSSATWPG